MNDNEFRNLYCWLVERVQPSAGTVARILRNILMALDENHRKRDPKRIDRK